MVHADLSTNLCSKCSGPLSFQPRVNVDLNLNDSFTRSPLSIREMVPLCNEDLDDYDAEIARLHSQITHVQVQRKRLIDYKTQIHSLLSSFHRFPNEVLCLIFESTCTKNLLQEYPVITYLPTLAISAVCMRWRSLVLASPALWSQIRVEIFLHDPSEDHDDNLPGSPNDGFMRTIQLYLDRSVHTPLTITVETVGDDSNSDPPALRLLLNHDYRWKTFEYSGDYDLGKWLRYDPSFPILERLMIESSFHMPLEDYTCFEDAPNLRHVMTGGQISNLPLTWDHLTSLDFHIFYDEDMSILRQFPALNVLKLRCGEVSFGPGITSLARLKSFTVVDPTLHGRPSLLESIFSSFTTSALEELIITQEINFFKLVWPPSTFSAFISRSTCVLTTLSLAEVEISDLDLIAALRLLPSLVEFRTCGLEDPDGGSSITAHFISTMHSSSTPPLLPRLQSLSMEIYTGTFDDAAFVDMVSSRWSPIVSSQVAKTDCLRSVVLYFFTRVVDKEVYEPLWRLDEMGMCVVITGL